MATKLQEKLPLIIAVAAGILAIFLLNIYLQSREAEILAKAKQVAQQVQPQAPIEETAIVLIAQRDIPPQVPITGDDIVVKEIPVQYIQPQVVTNIGEVVGQIAAAPISQGEQILKTKLLPPHKVVKSLSEITPKGKRAITIVVDNVATVAGFLKPGDYVDVFAFAKPPKGTAWLEDDKKADKPILLPIFQGVEVLAVGKQFSGASIPIEGAPAPAQPKTGDNTVTLALKPQEAILLSFINKHGDVRLALRSSEDVEPEPIRPEDWDTLFSYIFPSRGPQPAIIEQKEFEGVEIYLGPQKKVIPLSAGER